MFRKIGLLGLVLLFYATVSLAQSDQLRSQLATWVKGYDKEYRDMGGFRLVRLRVDARSRIFNVYISPYFGSIPFRPALVDKMKSEIEQLIMNDFPQYKVIIYADQTDINQLVPNVYRVDDVDKSRLPITHKTPKVFVKNLSQPYSVTHGLANRNLALWHGHGWYYDQRTDRWRWQRARLFETVEDKFTMSYVLPYLVPMLENAGAYVLLPRERDVQKHEVIVDNDSPSTSSSIYREKSDRNFFDTGGSSGFAHKRLNYTNNQNPFVEGTYRTVKTALNSNATIEWIPDIPELGEYAVYVAYKILPNSITDAHYTVYHAGGETHFRVNQTMGGGTWIYLGTFQFSKGLNSTSGKVVLSNKSKTGGVIVADAVRFGGGMGNVARCLADSVLRDSIKARKSQLISPYLKTKWETSGRARYLEGARYWLQWAGAPTDVYAFSGGLNDYVDDYSSRGAWVNWLNQGSVNSPDSVGLGIPIDLSFGFHSDAGCRMDTTVGTLGIFTTQVDSKTGNEKFLNGQSRYASRDLADIVTDALVHDIQALACPTWSFRGLWNKSYSESRRPDVPAMLLEFLSHQNFTDMQYGLDPRFQFIVSRAIYKGVLRFVASQYDVSYVVQPLPVSHFSAQLVGDSVLLMWRAVTDSLEKTAQPTAYVVYTRAEDEAFDNGKLVHGTNCKLPLAPNKIYSYKVVAVNEGGASFPSEILSVCRNTVAQQTVLIVNGFDRISAPEGFSTGDMAGFPNWLDAGVPYKRCLSYVGAQHEFKRSVPWMDDDAPGWGASNSDYDTEIIAGNTFDYPLIHGRALRKSGFSFVSCSNEAIESSCVNMSDYKAVDWILGEQKQVMFASDTTQWDFKTFTKPMQEAITNYCLQGGALFVSGAYVGFDLWCNNRSSLSDKQFAKTILKYTWRADKASQTGTVVGVYAPIWSFNGDFLFCTTLNERQYAVESPDAIEPADQNAFTVMRYAQNNMSAAIAYKGAYRTVVCGFPFEALTSEEQRNEFMWQIMQFLVDKK